VRLPDAARGRAVHTARLGRPGWELTPRAMHHLHAVLCSCGVIIIDRIAHRSHMLSMPCHANVICLACHAAYAHAFHSCCLLTAAPAVHVLNVSVLSPLTALYLTACVDYPSRVLQYPNRVSDWQSPQLQSAAASVQHVWHVAAFSVVFCDNQFAPSQASRIASAADLRHR
jgi:hypothetical protein